MAVHESQVDAVARVYAQSLFELAETAGGQAAIEETADELESIVELSRSDRTFGEFLTSSILAADKRAGSLRAIFAGRISERTLRFLLVLNDKGRLGRLESIAEAFDMLLQEKFGRVEVGVWTATPADAATLDAIRDRLRAALKREPVLHASVDESMLGGIRLQVGDQLIDGSVATRLRRMKEQLSQRGAAAVRSGADRFLAD